jgi:hypothetical protein
MVSVLLFSSVRDNGHYHGILDKEPSVRRTTKWQNADRVFCGRERLLGVCLNWTKSFARSENGLYLIVNFFRVAATNGSRGCNYQWRTSWLVPPESS